MEGLKFCKFCGEKIPEDAIICTHCGRQVEELKKNSDSPIVINNNNNNNNSNVASAVKYGRKCSKWTSFFLCLFLGVFGAHKFYEGKIGLGLLWLFTGGMFVIGTIISLLNILGKPDPYYVN